MFHYFTSQIIPKISYKVFSPSHDVILLLSNLGDILNEGLINIKVSYNLGNGMWSTPVTISNINNLNDADII